MPDLTPRQIVAELDRDIVGQDDAKRAVAIALRNRWRRRQRSREKMKARLEAGELEGREVEVTLPGRAVAPVSILGAGNLEQMEMDLQGMFEKIIPKPTQT